MSQTKELQRSKVFKILIQWWLAAMLPLLSNVSLEINNIKIIIINIASQIICTRNTT